MEMPHNITPMLLKLKALKDIGYNHEFMISPEGLRCLETNKIYQPEEINIMDHFRFEGISDPEDMSILYTLVCNDGVKGTIVDAFGTYGNSELMDFIKQVDDHTIDHL